MYGELKRAVHIDFHTNPGIYDFNREWDAAAYAERLSKAHVRYVNAFAECNLGFCYFDTKIGVPYPGMKGDMLGDLIAECHKRDIGVTAYLNLGIDHEACRRHRDWMKVNKDGQVMWGDRTGNGFRLPCYETGYGEWKLALIQELLTLHPEVDGLFLDCINFVPCYGNECLEAIAAEGGDPTSDADVAAHTHKSVMTFLSKVKKMLGNRNFICNSQPYWLMRENNTHVEVECLPSSGWGYDYFNIQAAYARNIKEKVLYMSGRFQRSWGDLGGLKSQAALENDMFDAVMNAVECSIGDHMHPAEIVDEKVYDRIGKVYETSMQYEPWTDGAKYRADVALVCPIDAGFFNAGTYGASYNGAARMLNELKLTYDVVNETMDFGKYRLLILPDNLRVTPPMAEKIAAHIAAGKPVLSVGEGGLNEAGDGFALPQYWNFGFEGLDKSTQMFYKYPDDTFRFAGYEPGILMNAAEGNTVLADYWKAYFNKINDGFHGYYYLPPEKATGNAAALVNGKVGHICFKVFGAYFHAAYVEHKELVRRVLNAVGFVPSFTTEGLPSPARVTVTETAENLLVHVKVDAPDLRGTTAQVEEHTKFPAGASVTIEGEYPDAILLPDGAKADVTVADGHTVIRLPQIEGYLPIALKK